MKNCVYVVSCMLLFSAAAVVYADDTNDTANSCVYNETCQRCSTSVFIPRPQGLNSAALYDAFYYPCCNKDIESALTFTAGYRYEQTWNGAYLADCLFGSSVLNFAGTNATKEPSTYYLLAENFGLSPNFIGSIAFDPVIKNNIIDFAARYEFGSFSPCLEKLYGSIAASLVNSAWDLRACEANFNTVVPDDLTLPQCLMGTTTAPALGDIKTALSGNYSFGQLSDTKMNYGRFIFDRSQSKTLLANLDLVLGYDLWRCAGYHIGLFAKAVAPTGNRPNPETVFAPIIGNAHHWELGGGLDAHWDLWNYDSQCLTAYVTGSITHLFKDKQLRTFDYQTNGCMSRYQLLKVFTADTPNNLPYTNQLTFGTNFATRQIYSSFDMMGDLTLKFVYRNAGLAFGVGYNVYGRSEETVQLLDRTTTTTVGNIPVGNKGDTGVCMISTSDGTTAPLPATKKNYSALTSDVTVEQPVDNQILVNDYKTWDDVTPAPNSSTPELFSTKDLRDVGAPRQLSQKLFGHIDYQWEDCENQPYVGFGGECEFAQNGQCNVCTASQWGMWIHGGLSF